MIAHLGQKKRNLVSNEKQPEIAAEAFNLQSECGAFAKLRRVPEAKWLRRTDCPKVLVIFDYNERRDCFKTAGLSMHDVPVMLQTC